MTDPSSMIETRCLPSLSWTATANCSRVTSFRPTLSRGSLEIAGEDVDFMGFRLSHRDHVNFVGCFGVTDRHNVSVEKARRIESLLTAVVTCIFDRERGAIEHLFRINKVKAVFFKIGCSLGLSPRELHGAKYTYQYIYVNVRKTELQHAF
jgi:hypothetical protein